MAPVGQKKSWSELKTVVNDIRRKLASLFSLLPTNINFRTLSDGRTRIYFLGTPPNGWETTLLYTDVGAQNESTHPQRYIHLPLFCVQIPFFYIHVCIYRLQSHLLLEPTASLSTNSTYSREVQLLLERKRLSTWGITSYELHKTSGKIVFPASNSLYQSLDTGYSVSPLFPSELRVCQVYAALDPQICPSNSDLTAYLSGGDIWVTHAVSGHGERLTYAHDGQRTFAEDPLTAGVPSYVMQEEFNRYEGFWWQPKSEGIYTTKTRSTGLCGGK